MKKKASFILSIMILAIILLPVSLVATGVLPYRVLVVQTGSMNPTYPPESIVIVKEHEQKLGEAITFYQHDTVITHRWLGVNSDGTLQTKGDANEKPDPGSVNKADVIGGVIASVPKLGYWLVFFKSPYSIGALFFGGLAIWLFFPLLREQDPVEETSSVQTV